MCPLAQAGWQGPTCVHLSRTGGAGRCHTWLSSLSAFVPCAEVFPSWTDGAFSSVLSLLTKCLRHHGVRGRRGFCPHDVHTCVEKGLDLPTAHSSSDEAEAQEPGERSCRSHTRKLVSPKELGLILRSPCLWTCVTVATGDDVTVYTCVFTKVQV